MFYPAVSFPSKIPRVSLPLPAYVLSSFLPRLEVLTSKETGTPSFLALRSYNSILTVPTCWTLTRFLTQPPRGERETNSSSLYQGLSPESTSYKTAVIPGSKLSSKPRVSYFPGYPRLAHAEDVDGAADNYLKREESSAIRLPYSVLNSESSLRHSSSYLKCLSDFIS